MGAALWLLSVFDVLSQELPVSAVDGSSIPVTPAGVDPALALPADDNKPKCVSI